MRRKARRPKNVNKRLKNSLRNYGFPVCFSHRQPIEENRKKKMAAYGVLHDALKMNRHFRFSLRSTGKIISSSRRISRKEVAIEVEVGGRYVCVYFFLCISIHVRMIEFDIWRVCI